LQTLLQKQVKEKSMKHRSIAMAIVASAASLLAFGCSEKRSVAPPASESAAVTEDGSSTENEEAVEAETTPE